MALHHASITIRATPRRVFEALTRPELVARWQFGRALSTSWRPGAPIRFRTAWEDGRVLEQHGRVLEVRAEELVKYSLYTPRPGADARAENHCMTTYRLRGEGGATRVELEQDDPLPHAFTPALLENVLAGLKETAEDT
jgi:uncharacterized protein YndB with AHSA1/START domain